MSKHYIAMAGLHGCLPNYVASHDDRDSALFDLISMHELNADAGLVRDLKETGIVELDVQEHGNEYAEVIECDCNHPEQHDDVGAP